MDSKPFVVIVNPASGHRRGLEVLEQVRPIFTAADAELDVWRCDGPRHAMQLAGSLKLNDYDGCCVIGGDGTVHEVVNGLLSRGEEIPFPIGLIPAGSGNTLHLHQHGRDPVEAARIIVAGKTSPLDVARVVMGGDVVYCINIVGWSAVADINCLAEKLRFLGPIRYAVAALRFIVNPRRRFARLTLDGQSYDDEFVFVIGCNTKFTGNGMKLAPQAEINDGKIDVVVVRKASRLELLKLFRRVFDGSHVSMPCVEIHQVHSYAIELDDQEPLNLDGEATGRAPFSVEVLPTALRIFS